MAVGEYPVQICYRERLILNISRDFSVNTMFFISFEGGGEGEERRGQISKLSRGVGESLFLECGQITMVSITSLNHR